MERYKTLNVFDFTVKREKPKLGISIVGKRLCRDKTNAGIYVGTIHESGDIAKDGRIDSGDLILQVNDTSFEGITNDDSFRLLKLEAAKPNCTIRIVVARPWDSKSETIPVTLV